MRIERHVFHTKHDFTPEFGWSAFQILSQELEPIAVRDLEDLARTVGSPLGLRADIGKVISGLGDIGLVIRNQEQVSLSAAGEALAASQGRYQDGFYKAVHCLYVWKWLWSDAKSTATPSWSYRKACQILSNAGPAGMSPDELVLQILDSAQQFGVEKVSFSRSSVSGVTMWLEAQHPPMIRREDRCLSLSGCSMPTWGTCRLHLSALRRCYPDDPHLTTDKLTLLSEALLRPASEVLTLVRAFCSESREFVFTAGSVPRIGFLGTDDPFLQWILTGK